MTDSLDIPVTELAKLPKTLRDALDRGAKDDRAKRLTPEQQETVAAEALRSGVRTKGPAFEYMVMRLRAGFGVGQRPSPPALPSHELAYVDGRIAEILDRLGLSRKAAA